MPERLALVDCDIALARYPPSLQLHRALRKRRRPPSLIRPPDLRRFSFLRLGSYSHSISHVGMSRYRYYSFDVPAHLTYLRF